MIDGLKGWQEAIREFNSTKITEDKPKPKPRMVVCAAILVKGSIHIGPRHFDQTMIRHMVSLGEIPEQGFIDQWGVFMTRRSLAGRRSSRSDQIPCRWRRKRIVFRKSVLGEMSVNGRSVNLSGQPRAAFWLPTSTDRFYPDFVALLQDDRLLVVEYKGAAYVSNDDSKEKRLIGELREKKAMAGAFF